MVLNISIVTIDVIFVNQLVIWNRVHEKLCFYDSALMEFTNLECWIVVAVKDYFFIDSNCLFLSLNF